MRPVLVLLTIPALVIGALALAGNAQVDSPPAGAESLRPDPVPEFTGMVFVPASEFLMGSTSEQV